ncbi:MAG: MFS transporter [Bacteroidia bacterium]|nr:MFS transporter [Bacteroidia bacterium]
MKQSAYAVLKIVHFRNFILARLFFTFAVNMQATVVGWQIYEYTKDDFALGLIGLAEVVPFLISAIFGGNIADIINRKKIIGLSASVYSLCALLLVLLSFGFQYQYVAIQTLPIYAVIFLTGIARGFLAPAQTAFLAQLVPRELYAQSATWNSVIWHISAIGGPAIGGLLYGFIGVGFTYTVVLTLSVIGVFLFVSVPKQPMPLYEKGKEGLKERLTVGLRFVFSQQVMLGALAIDMFAVLFGGAVALLPSFADRVLHVGALGLGVLRAAPAAGALIMAAIMTWRPPLSNAGRNMLIAVAGFGVSTILFAISENFWVSLVMLALTGMFDNVSVVIRSTILQLYTPDEMRGRVSAVNSIFISTSNELGAFESGLAARLMGLIPSVIFGGGMTLLITAFSAKVFPELRNLNLHNKLNEKQ